MLVIGKVDVRHDTYSAIGFVLVPLLVDTIMEGCIQAYPSRGRRATIAGHEARQLTIVLYISTFESRAGSLRVTQQPNGSLISLP